MGSDKDYHDAAGCHQRILINSTLTSPRAQQCAHRPRQRQIPSFQCSRRPIHAARTQSIPYHRPSGATIKTAQCPRRKPSMIAVTLAPIQARASPSATTRSTVENRDRSLDHCFRDATLESLTIPLFLQRRMTAIPDPAPGDCPITLPWNVIAQWEEWLECIGFAGAWPR